jgi:adenosylcobinamide kinase/adenosylcobinamide-phosphate guanylyltransferase
MSKKIVFITGGVRSGKSSFVLKEASKIPSKKVYIATAEALDEEMRERIEDHKRKRGRDWDTYEEPIKIADVIKNIKDQYSVIVIDCLTLWLSNLFLNNKNVEKEIEYFCCSLSTVHCPLFIVSNEVGMGIVPENKMARNFRDMAGILNQKVAKISDEVYVVVAGIPLKIKEKYDTGEN